MGLPMLKNQEMQLFIGFIETSIKEDQIANAGETAFGFMCKKNILNFRHVK